jgi:hypothetical protein
MREQLQQRSTNRAVFRQREQAPSKHWQIGRRINKQDQGRLTAVLVRGEVGLQDLERDVVVVEFVVAESHVHLSITTQCALRLGPTRKQMIKHVELPRSGGCERERVRWRQTEQRHAGNKLPALPHAQALPATNERTGFREQRRTCRPR